MCLSPLASSCCFKSKLWQPSHLAVPSHPQLLSGAFPQMVIPALPGHFGFHVLSVSGLPRCLPASLEQPIPCFLGDVPPPSYSCSVSPLPHQVSQLLLCLFVSGSLLRPGACMLILLIIPAFPCALMLSRN